ALELHVPARLALDDVGERGPVAVDVGDQPARLARAHLHVRRQRRRAARRAAAVAPDHRPDGTLRRRMTPRAWRAEPDEAETVARLLVAFRDDQGRDWPSANAFLAGVERLIEDPATEFLLAALHDDAAPGGVCALRYRHGLWLAAPDCWLEDLYVRPDDRRAGVAVALVELALGQARERGCRRIELDVS